MDHPIFFIFNNIRNNKGKGMLKIGILKHFK